MQFSIGLGFTSNCNMNCPFCYSKKRRSIIDEIPFDRWIEFIDRNSQFIKDINYGTGENTTSNTWYQFINYVRRKYPSIRQALTTNGALSYVVKRDEIKKSIIIECIDEIDVSLDFGCPERHNYYRGNNEAYDWAIDTLSFCNIYKKDATIVLLGIDETLTSENLHAIFNIAKEYHAKVRINLYRPVDKDSGITPINLDKVDWLFHWINSNQEFLSISDPLFSSLYFSNYVKADPSGISSIRIIHNGDIYPSTYLLMDELRMGNITSFDLGNIENNLIYNRIQNITLPKECQECKLSTSCQGGVLDRRYLWYQSFEERDPYCPTRYVNNFDDYIVKRRKFSILNSEFSSVHDGYLPTLFFGYKRN